ncbi:MOP flippase family protein [Desulfoglaeba alkanexedens]|uniref:MOP flippase family protein n=1 Tax=Desulfoglaeba alkanexedens ALDC TaxID=980445 RepID=A0A4P8KZ75_9BACT|nr:MOP flippase family protein [Desulfoglaeba alkanexedens]QCQ20829.1 MOP flippase family protein [Desulfoglaeba alkanexedens ALDC]
MGLKEKTVSGVKWSGISMGAVTALQFATLAILARLLSPADFGLMGMIMVVIGFAQAFADMGISNAIIHRQDATKDQLSSLYWLNILAGFIVFCVVCASTPLVVEFYNEPRLTRLLYLTALVFLITPLGQQFQILLQKELKFDGLAKIEIATAVVNSTVSIGVAFAGLGVYSLICGQLAGTTVKVVLLCGIGWRNWRPSFHFAKQDVKGYIGFGLYQMGERSINYLNSNLDYLLIGSMLGARALGYYTLAYNLIIRPSTMINPVITKVAFPVLSLIQNETDKLRRGYLQVVQVLAMVNFPILMGLAVVAPVAVPVIFGDQWLPSVILIQILTIVGLLRSIGNPIGSLLLAKGRADLGFKWNLGLTVTQIPGLYLGAGLGGAVGVAIAFSVLTVLYCIFSYLVLIRTLLGPCLRDYVQSMWPALWMSAVMGAVICAIGALFQNDSRLIIFILQVFIGSAVFISLFFFNEKILFNELKSMLFNRKVVVVAEE